MRTLSLLINNIYMWVYHPLLFLLILYIIYLHKKIMYLLLISFYIPTVSTVRLAENNDFLYVVKVELSILPVPTSFLRDSIGKSYLLEEYNVKFSVFYIDTFVHTDLQQRIHFVIYISTSSFSKIVRMKYRNRSNRQIIQIQFRSFLCDHWTLMQTE